MSRGKLTRRTVAGVGATIISGGKNESIVSAILAVVAVLVLVHALYRMSREREAE